MLHDGPEIYVWPVNLRVYPPKKLDLRVARKSTTSPLPVITRESTKVLHLEMNQADKDI